MIVMSRLTRALLQVDKQKKCPYPILSVPPLISRKPAINKLKRSSLRFLNCSHLPAIQQNVLLPEDEAWALETLLAPN